MYEVYYESFYVRAVVVLISHNHDRAISERLYIFVLFANLKPDNLSKIRNLRIICNLLRIGLTHI